MDNIKAFFLGIITFSFLGICGTCFLSIVFVLMPGPETDSRLPKSTPTPDVGHHIYAKSKCEDVVKDRLKSPSTADFVSNNAEFRDNESMKKDYDIEATYNSGIWISMGKVDSQNGFGAMIRSNFVCMLDYRKEDETWFLLDVSIDG